MMKKMIILVCLYIAIILIGIFVLLNNNIFNICKDNRSDANTNIGVYNYYDEYTKILKYNSLFYYLCYNTDYNNVSVTDNYRNRYKDSISEIYSFKQYNTEIYNYDIYSYNQMLTTVQIDDSQDENIFRVDLLILKEPYADHPLLNKQIYFKYKLDKNGYVDDIEFIKEEVFREDDGTPIIRPNARKFDYHIGNCFKDFEYLVLGLDYIIYDIEKFNDYDNYYYQDLEWEMKEYALTNNLKSKYDLYKGLVPEEIKNNVYKNHQRIICNIRSNDFTYQSNDLIPIEICIDNYSYPYNLLYSITDDFFLDDISLLKTE